jgi:hypothetical protein
MAHSSVETCAKARSHLAPVPLEKLDRMRQCHALVPVQGFANYHCDKGIFILLLDSSDSSYI